MLIIYVPHFLFPVPEDPACYLHAFLPRRFIFFLSNIAGTVVRDLGANVTLLVLLPGNFGIHRKSNDSNFRDDNKATICKRMPISEGKTGLDSVQLGHTLVPREQILTQWVRYEAL